MTIGLTGSFCDLVLSLEKREFNVVPAVTDSFGSPETFAEIDFPTLFNFN